MKDLSVDLKRHPKQKTPSTTFRATYLKRLPILCFRFGAVSNQIDLKVAPEKRLLVLPHFVYDFLQVRPKFINRMSSDLHRAVVCFLDDSVVCCWHPILLSQDDRPVNVHRYLPCALNAASAIASETVNRQSRSSAVCHPALYSRLPIA